MGEFGCPTCGRVFDSRRGLGVHHSVVHDEKLPNRECAACGEKFHAEYEKQYCSEECHDEAVSYQGEANPHYQGGKETTGCEICGAEFEYYPSAVVRKPSHTLYCLIFAVQCQPALG